MTATLEDGVFVIEEVDAPEGGAGRCDCMCVFDFALEIEGIAAGLMPIQLFRDVTDVGGGPQLVWEGVLDLGEGSGTIVIDDTDVYPWCE
jgi:hypothetical protein